MTNPTADAIAALARAESLADCEGFDDSAAYFREVRSALLSAQGQAGKPVELVSNSYKLATARAALEAAEKAMMRAPRAGATDVDAITYMDWFFGIRIPALTSVASALATIKGLER